VTLCYFSMTLPQHVSLNRHTPVLLPPFRKRVLERRHHASAPACPSPVSSFSPRLESLQVILWIGFFREHFFLFPPLMFREGVRPMIVVFSALLFLDITFHLFSLTLPRRSFSPPFLILFPRKDLGKSKALPFSFFETPSHFLDRAFHPFQGTHRLLFSAPAQIVGFGPEQSDFFLSPSLRRS